jgi:hypothetical protein
MFVRPLLQEDSDETNSKLEYLGERETIFTNNLSANRWSLRGRLMEEKRRPKSYETGYLSLLATI